MYLGSFRLYGYGVAENMLSLSRRVKRAAPIVGGMFEIEDALRRISPASCKTTYAQTYCVGVSEIKLS